jgi:hypothetical protein
MSQMGKSKLDKIKGEKGKEDKGKGEKASVVDPLLAARFVQNLTGAVADELIENREGKIAEPLKDLFDEVQRLDRLGIDNQTFQAVYDDLSRRLNDATQLTDKNAHYKALDKIKNDARVVVEKIPIAVAGHMASAECTKLLGLIDEEIGRLRQANLDQKHAKGIAGRKDILEKDYNDVLKMTTETTEKNKAKEKSFQAIRGRLRKEAHAVRTEVSDLLLASTDLANLANEAEQAYALANAGVQTVKQDEVRQGLMTRLQESKTNIDKAKTTDVSKGPTEKKLACDNFRKGAKEARAICALLKPGKNHPTVAEDMHQMVADVKTQALNDPSGAEGQMMASYSTEKNFEKALRSACEVVALAEADVRLTPGEVLAIYDYTTVNYTKINGYLLGSNELTTKEVETFKKRVEVAKKALANLPSYEGGMTMRGERPWEGYKKTYVEGKTYTIPIFWSTGVKMCFTDPLQISVFGKTGKDVQAMSAKAEETEVLFPPGTTFKVITVRERGENMFITLEEV